LKYTGSLDNFRKALEGDPGDPDYHFNVGLALFRAGRFDEAAESFRAVLDRTPEDAEAIAMLGRALQKPSARRSAIPDPPERVKETFEESAWLQLKAVLQPRR
jgi:cytochrome c-type biogenesis protein CcmH/NrfG